MAYKISRAQRIQETLELTDEVGKVQHTISVDLDIDRVAAEFNKRYNTVVRAEKAAKAVHFTSTDSLVEMSEDAAAAANAAIEAFGEAVINLFELVFGEEGATILVQFFDGKHFEMCLQVIPFISEVVMPAMSATAKEQQSRLADNYKLATATRKGFNRNQRRNLGL